MKLSEALAAAKDARETTEPGSLTQEIAFDDLIRAVEAYLEAQKKEADIILGLAELRRWGGSE